MRKLLSVLGFGLLLFSIEGTAQQTEKLVIAKFLIEGGIEYGGDEILEVFFTNGEDQTMRAG